LFYQSIPFDPNVVEALVVTFFNLDFRIEFRLLVALVSQKANRTSRHQFYLWVIGIEYPEFNIYFLNVLRSPLVVPNLESRPALTSAAAARLNSTLLS
jgi:hypothetical protein